MNIGSETLLVELPGVGEATTKRLTRLGLRTVRDLWEHLPFRHEDYSRLTPIGELSYDQEAVICGRVSDVSWRYTKRRVLLIQARIEDETGKIRAIWFNQRYLLKLLVEGQTITLFGVKKPLKTLGNPLIVKRVIGELEVAPIYRTTAGLSQTILRRLIRSVLPVLEQAVERLPADLVKENITYQQAIVLAHRSTSALDQDQARDRLALEELIILNLKALVARASRDHLDGLPIPFDQSVVRQFVRSLPFSLTGDQRRAAWEIISDLTEKRPMNRLLYGEVGSGKTVVALLVSLSVLRTDHRVIWLSPTVALASQLFEVAQKFLQPFKTSVELITSAHRSSSPAQFTVGTQAVFSRLGDLGAVGLVIIDEQHRFGVDQRQILLKNHPRANLLMMTATPIPRSLAQTIFGHLDLTYIREKPALQRPVETVLFSEGERLMVEKQIGEKLAAGEPGYVICPLIDPQATEPSLTLFNWERKTVVEEEKRLSRVFPQARIVSLHGRLRAVEKERIIRDFRSGKIDILLATTVVEVGIDNPQATWMLVEGAEMFGLATLHQLRGRIGRGRKQATCFLSAPAESKPRERLEMLGQAADGLEIAEADLALRGPGELLGEAQSGLADLKFLKVTDRELYKRANRLARHIFASGLEKYPLLAKLVEEDADQTVLAA